MTHQNQKTGFISWNNQMLVYSYNEYEIKVIVTYQNETMCKTYSGQETFLLSKYIGLSDKRNRYE